MNYKSVKARVTKHKEKHILFASKGGYLFLGIIAGWSAAHYFVCSSDSGVWPHEILYIDFLIELVNKMGGLTVVVGAAVAIYTVYLKGKGKGTGK
jgi:hypothetical protein